MVASTAPGTRATVKVIRQGKAETLNIKVGEMEMDDNALVQTSGEPQSGTAALGLVVEALTADQRDALDIDAGQGVVISRVTGMQAREAGLQAGDVILMVGQTRVGSVAEYKAATKDVKPGDVVMLLISNRSGNAGFVTITAPAGAN